MPLITLKFGEDKQLNQILTLLASVVATQDKQGKDIKKIMTDLEQAQQSLKRIDDATTLQGNVLQQEATTLKQISDEFDALIKTGTGSQIPADFLSALQAQADRSEAMSVSLQAQADFSKSIAAKGVTDPTPLPVPNPTV